MISAARPEPEAKARAIALVFVAIALILALQPTASCGHDEERASGAEWLYLTIVAVSAVILMIVIVVVWRRRANPHTGLPGRIRRARARGPLKNRPG